MYHNKIHNILLVSSKIELTYFALPNSIHALSWITYKLSIMNDRGVLQGLDAIHMKFIGVSTIYLPLMCSVFRVEEKDNMISWSIL